MRHRHASPSLGRLLSSVTIVALLATPAAAQEREGVFQMLGRIILGAGTAKVAIDTPQAVSVLEEEDLDRLQPKSSSDLFKNIPGVQTSGASTRPLGQAFNIRGIGTIDTSSSEDRIKVNVDGAPKFFEGYRMGSFFGDLDLYKRVEVLRGPASSVLYGSGAIGGVINFTTRDASDYLTADQNTALRLKAGTTSNGNTNTLSAIWANRVGNAEFLLALNSSDGGTIKDGAGANIRGTAHESVSGLLKSRFTFGNDNDQSVEFSWSRTDSKLNGTEVLQTGGSGMFFDIFGTHDLRTVDDTANLTWRHEFAGNDLLDLKVQLSFTDTQVEKRNFRTVAGAPAACTGGRNSILCDSDYGYRTTMLKLENTSTFSTGDWENFVTAGVLLSEQKRTARTVGIPAGSTTGPAFDFHPEGTDRRLAAYVQGEFTWNDRLTFISGVRVEKGERSPSALTAANSYGRAVGDVSDTATSFSLAALYKLNDNFSIFGSVAKTERLPTLDELYASSTGQRPGLELNKEKAEAFELGVAWQGQDVLAADDSLQVKVTAFHNDMKDMIDRGASTQPFMINRDRAKIWGAELEASYDADRWFASIAWSKIKSKDRATGRALATTPAENLALTVGAKFPEQNLVVGWRGYYFDNTKTGTVFSITPLPTGAGKAYDSHDIFVTWKPDAGALAGMEVNFAVENIFDKEYINNLTSDKGAGRNAKLTLAKTFAW